MVAEITQAQNNAVLTGKTTKNERLSFKFEAELRKKMEIVKTIEQLLPQNNATTSTQITKQKTEPKEPTKTRAEQIINTMKQLLQNAAEKAKSTLSPEKIEKMSLGELQNAAKSLMGDMRLFTDMANSLEYLKNVPEDCCSIIDFNSNGKCILFKIFRPDGTVIDGNLDDVPGVFTDNDFKKLIEKMDMASLKSFCLDGADPLKLFEDIFDNFKNADFGTDKALEEKIEKIPSQIEQIKAALKTEKTA